MSTPSPAAALGGSAWPFLIACAAAHAALALLVPPHHSLLTPDSDSYIAFDSYRTAFYPVFLRGLTGLGLSLTQITYVQVALSSLALMVLLAALLRAGLSRWVAALVTVALGANGYVTTYHHMIMTESLALAVALLTVGCWIDYLRTGRAKHLALVGLCVGIMTGLRPAGAFMVPMVALSAWLKWHRRDVPAPMLIAALVVPLAIGPVAERLIHRAVHDSRSDAVFTVALLGKAAMLVQPQTTFAGPHAQALNALGARLLNMFQPVHAFIAKTPLPARPTFISTYELIGQYQAVGGDVAQWAVRTGVPADVLRRELGTQAILANMRGYIDLSLTHYVGQWSVAPLRFPPTARAVNALVDSDRDIPLRSAVDDLILHPVASQAALIFYPASLVGAAVTLALALVAFAFVFRPTRGDAHPSWLYASFFAATAHVHVLLIAFTNVSTPRYLIPVYPQIVVSVLFLVLAITGRRSRA